LFNEIKWNTWWIY